MLLLFLQNLQGGGGPIASPFTTFTLKATVGGGGAHNAPIQITAGDTFSLVFPLLTPSGAQPNFSSPSAIFELFTTPFPMPWSTMVLEKSTGSGSATLAQVNGAWVFTVNFAIADTESIIGGGFFFQVQVDDGLNKATVADGQIQIASNLIG